MKSLFAFVLSIMLFCCGAPAVFAEEATYHTAGDLYSAWYHDLPDYICGVWSTDGSTDNLTFGIQNNEAGNAGKQKMLDLIENDATVSFVYQTYSRNALLQMQKEIRDVYMAQNLGLVYTALYEQENRIVLGIDEQRTEDEATKNLIAHLTNQYGAAVYVEYTGLVYTTGTAPANKQPMLFSVIAAAMVMVLLIFLIIINRKNAMRLQTSQGTTISASALLSVKQVEQLVGNSHCYFPADLDEKVMRAIQQKT